MTVFTKSLFYYGHTVTRENRSIDFKEGSSNFSAFLRVGSYGLQDFALEITRAMNLVSDNNYISSINRVNRTIEITGDIAFELLPATGVNSGTSALPLAGFDVDTSSQTSHEGGASGKMFEPLLILQDFTPFDFDVESTDAVVNETASGRVETVTYGLSRFMSCNIRFQTNKSINGVKNENAVSELKEFMDYIITKGTIEFMSNKGETSSFTPCILESTARSSLGVGYRLEESNGIPGFYDTGRLVFRERVL